MSDPVTNVDIEDVLTSIRKLVSEGEKARTRDSLPNPEPETSADTKVASPSESAPEPTQDRLVLTPDFRVPDDSPKDEPTVAATEVMPEDSNPRGDQVETTDQDEAVAAPIILHAVPSGDEDMATSDIAPDFDATALSEPRIDAAADPIDFVAAQEEEKPSALSSLEATIAELEAAVGTGEEDYEPDGSEDGAGTARLSWPDQDGSDAEQPEDLAGSVDAETHEAERGDTGFGTMDPEIEETQAHPSEPDWGDAEAESEDDLRRAGLDDTFDEWGGDVPPGLEEDALRSMVADIVREELQGAMGERITRNVRKLVRREIYRILASQDFD